MENLIFLPPAVCRLLLLLLSRVVLGVESLLQQCQVSLGQIKVCSRDNSLAFISSNPINNLRRVCSQISSIILIERLAIFSGKNPDVCVLTSADVVQVCLETGLGCRRR